jgi:hypothetical protein
MQNPMLTADECRFNQSSERKPKPTIRIGSDVIDYLLRTYPSDSAEFNIGFNVVFNEDGSYKIEKHRTDYGQFTVHPIGNPNPDELDISPGVHYGLCVNTENILSSFDLIIDESLNYPAYRVYIDCHTNMSHYMTIYGQHLYEIGFNHSNITLIADSIYAVIMYHGPENTARNITCSRVKELFPVNPGLKSDIEERGRRYQQERKAMMLIDALMLARRRRCSIREDQQMNPTLSGQKD